MQAPFLRVWNSSILTVQQSGSDNLKIKICRSLQKILLKEHIDTWKIVLPLKIRTIAISFCLEKSNIRYVYGWSLPGAAWLSLALFPEPPRRQLAGRRSEHVIIRSHVCLHWRFEAIMPPIRIPVVGWHIEKERLDPIKPSRETLVMIFRMHPVYNLPHKALPMPVFIRDFRGLLSAGFCYLLLVSNIWTHFDSPIS